MNYLLMSCCGLALILFAFTRPRWRQIGPSLLDSFVIGLCLYGLGSILVWIEGLPDSEIVMRIGTATALSGILGASLWGYLFAPRVARINFFADARQLCADPNDHFTISAGFVISTLVSLILLVAVFSHPHVRSLLLDALFHGAGTLNEARLIVSSGTEGYFAPGYVKQFRDIIVPILCVAAILCDGTYRHRGLLYIALVVALATTFVSGQRLVIIQYILCLGIAFLIDRFSSRPRFASLAVVVALLLVLVGTVGFMSKMLGRLDVALSPMVEQQKQQLRRDFLGAQEKTLEAALRRLRIAQEKLKAASSDSRAELKSAQKELEDAEAEAAAVEQTITKLKLGSPLPSEVSGTLLSSGIPSVFVPVIALAHRAVIAVPRENTISYSFWSTREHAVGSGWITDLAGIRPGTQNQLSNDLSEVNRGGSLGNSPLGLATDVYYNSGWYGVLIVPALYALFFMWLDVALTATNSPLTSAAKIFMFFSIPLMYSPFMFILYGGLVAVGILCYVWLLRNGAFSFLGLRPQTRQSPH